MMGRVVEYNQDITSGTPKKSLMRQIAEKAPEEKKAKVAELMERVHKASERCEDFDDDCFTVLDHDICYAYDPEKGDCPFKNRKS